VRRVADGVFEFDDTEIDILVGALRLLSKTHREEAVPAEIEDIIYDKDFPPSAREEHLMEADDFDQMADRLLEAEPPDDLSQMLNKVAPKKKKDSR